MRIQTSNKKRFSKSPPVSRFKVMIGLDSHPYAFCGYFLLGFKYDLVRESLELCARCDDGADGDDDDDSDDERKNARRRQVWERGVDDVADVSAPLQYSRHSEGIFSLSLHF